MPETSMKRGRASGDFYLPEGVKNGKKPSQLRQPRSSRSDLVGERVDSMKRRRKRKKTILLVIVGVTMWREKGSNPGT